MAYMELYWSWDCAEFDEIVILERVFFDYGEGSMVARIHCSGRPRRRDVEVPPGTRRWASLLKPESHRAAECENINRFYDQLKKVPGVLYRRQFSIQGPIHD